MLSQDKLKELAAKKSVDWIKDSMTVGLGTGSTVKYMVAELGKRVKNGLKVTCVTTSKITEMQAKSLNIPLKSIDEVKDIDLTIDGADEISSDFSGIKGGGAALLFEKIVAINSKKILWIVDESKVVDKLGKFPLPVEVIPFGSQHLLHRFQEQNLNPSFRKKEDGTFILTDSNNYIIDLHLNTIEEPNKLSDYLINQVGVVEHGLFLNMSPTVIVAKQNEISVLHAR